MESSEKASDQADTDPESEPEIGNLNNNLEKKYPKQVTEPLDFNAWSALCRSREFRDQPVFCQNPRTGEICLGTIMRDIASSPAESWLIDIETNRKSNNSHTKYLPFRLGLNSEWRLYVSEIVFTAIQTKKIAIENRFVKYIPRDKNQPEKEKKPETQLLEKIPAQASPLNKFIEEIGDNIIAMAKSNTTKLQLFGKDYKNIMEKLTVFIKEKHWQKYTKIDQSKREVSLEIPTDESLAGVIESLKALTEKEIACFKPINGSQKRIDNKTFNLHQLKPHLANKNPIKKIILAKIEAGNLPITPKNSDASTTYWELYLIW